MFDNLRPVSLDKDSLSEQIQAHRVLVSDIQDHKARVRGVAEKCRGAPGAQEMVNNRVFFTDYKNLSTLWDIFAEHKIFNVCRTHHIFHIKSICSLGKV